MPNTTAVVFIDQLGVIKFWGQQQDALNACLVRSMQIALLLPESRDVTEIEV
jgi:hypothetical protein